MSSDDHGLDDSGPDSAGLARLAGEVLSRESAALAALVGTVESTVVTVARQMLDVAGKVVTTGSGTSGIMAERLAHLLSVCGTPAESPDSPFAVAASSVAARRRHRRAPTPVT